MRVFDETGRELTTIELRAEISRRDDPTPVAVELLDGQSTRVTMVSIPLPPDVAATVARARLVDELLTVEPARERA